MEYQWGAGCTERCKSGSERGLQKSVSQRHKALLSYSTTSALPPFPHGKTAQATTAECWKCVMRRIRRVWISRCCCAPARAAHGLPTACFMRAWLRPFRWPNPVEHCGHTDAAGRPHAHRQGELAEQYGQIHPDQPKIQGRRVAAEDGYGGLSEQGAQE